MLFFITRKRAYHSKSRKYDLEIQLHSCIEARLINMVYGVVRGRGYWQQHCEQAPNERILSCLNMGLSKSNAIKRFFFSPAMIFKPRRKDSVVNLCIFQMCEIYGFYLIRLVVQICLTKNKISKLKHKKLRISGTRLIIFRRKVLLSSMAVNFCSIMLISSIDSCCDCTSPILNKIWRDLQININTIS